MPAIAKRKLRQTWREAVALRAGDQAPRLLPRFDAMHRSGLDEAEAAYRVLEEAGLLWLGDEPSLDRPTTAPPDEVPAV